MRQPRKVSAASPVWQPQSGARIILTLSLIHIFACIGIPIGIILASLVSFAIVPAFLDRGFERGQSSMDAVVSVSYTHLEAYGTAAF